MKLSERGKDLRKKEKFENSIFLKWVKTNWKLLLFIIIAAYLYSVIHEIVHYSIFNYFGYSGEFCWTCIPTQVRILTPVNEVIRNHYFISAVAPYLLSSILLACLFFLFLLTKKKVLIILSIIPFLDTLINILTIPLAYFTKTGNDFLNLFRNGFYQDVCLIMLAPIVLFAGIWISYKKELRMRSRNRGRH